MTGTAPTVTAFDYSQLTEDYQGELVAVAERIRNRTRRAVTDIIENGRDLLAIKAELERGLFLAWIRAEFAWSERAAEYYMALAREWGDVASATVADLPVKLLYDLSSRSTPDEIKAEVRADLDAGKPVDVKAIKGRIEDARWQRQQAQAQAQKLNKRHRGKPVSESTRRRREREEAKRIEEAEQRDAERKAAAVEIVEILHRLPEQDFERLLDLLDTASLWVVQEMLNRGRS